MANISQGQLRALINQMVEQAVGEKMASRQSSWMSQQTSTRSYLTYEHNRNKKEPSSTLSDIYGMGSALSGLGGIFVQQAKWKHASSENSQQAGASRARNAARNATRSKTGNKTGGLDDSSLYKFGNFIGGLGQGLQGFAGLGNAYQNRDPLGGAMAGYQMMTGIGGMIPKVASNSSLMGTLGWVGLGLGLLTGLFG